MCHALARETSGSDFISQPCIYCQIDDSSDEYHEARFIPEDSTSLDQIYAAFSECASLNPDPIEEEEGEWIYNEDEVNASNQSRLSHLENIFQEPTPDQLQQMFLNGQQGQFDDPNEQSETQEETTENNGPHNKKQKNEDME